MKKYIYIFITCLLATNLTAQTVWKAELDSIKESGYYNIEIDQELIGVSKHDLSELRIKDDKGTEIPYFLRETTSVKEVSSFEDYDLVQNIAKDSLNTLVVKNDSKENINRFYIIINKADVKTEASIKGSNDGRQWYIVKQRTGISVFKEENKDEAMIVLDFPNGNYSFYEVSLFSNQPSPLDIKGVKKLKSSHIYGRFPEIKQASKINVENKDKQTIITFPQLENEYVIGKIEVFIDSKTEYLRSFSIKDTVSNYNLVDVELSSKSDNIFYLLSDYSKLNRNTIGVINNYNNPPLSIDSIKIFGLERYACAYLEEGKRYYLEINERVSPYPNYDIEHFKNEISTDLPVVRSVDLTSYIAPNLDTREPIFIEKPVFLWSVIIGVGVLLTIVSISMIIKMKRREE